MTTPAVPLRIVPERTALTEPYWDAAERGLLMLQTCVACGSTWHPPQPSCPDCRSTDWHWQEASGRGELLASTLVRHAGHRAVADHVPYVLAVVRLAEGPIFLSNLTAAAGAPELARPGDPVRLELGPTPGGLMLVHAVVAPTATT